MIGQVLAAGVRWRKAVTRKERTKKKIEEEEDKEKEEEEEKKEEGGEGEGEVPNQKHLNLSDDRLRFISQPVDAQL